MKHAGRLWATSRMNAKNLNYDKDATAAFVALHQQRDATCDNNNARQHPPCKLETDKIDFGNALLLDFGSVVPAHETQTSAGVKRVKREDGQ